MTGKTDTERAIRAAAERIYNCWSNECGYYDKEADIAKVEKVLLPLFQSATERAEHWRIQAACGGVNCGYICNRCGKPHDIYGPFYSEGEADGKPINPYCKDAYIRELQSALAGVSIMAHPKSHWDVGIESVKAPDVKALVAGAYAAAAKHPITTVHTAHHSKDYCDGWIAGQDNFREHIRALTPADARQASQEELKETLDAVIDEMFEDFRDGGAGPSRKTFSQWRILLRKASCKMVEVVLPLKCGHWAPLERQEDQYCQACIDLKAAIASAEARGRLEEHVGCCDTCWQFKTPATYCDRGKELAARSLTPDAK